MREPFSHLIATLRKAQDTMRLQLVRLGQARQPDKVRLPRMQKEAGQLRGAAAVLLGRMMQQEAGLELVLQTKGLVAFFAQAEQQAAALMKRGDPAGPDATSDDAGVLNEIDSQLADEEPASSALAGSGRSRIGAGSTTRGRRSAARIAKLGHSRDPSASAVSLARRRSSL